MSRVTAKTDGLKIQSTDDGLHLKSTILWLDAYAQGQLSFISAVEDHSKAISPQIITTEESTRILESFRRKPNALVCQYNRPFSIGRLRMELLPSGHTLGGASLLVETDHGPLLYAPYLQSQKIPTVRQMQLPKAKILILGAHQPDPQLTVVSRKKEKERFVQTLSAQFEKGLWPIVLCETIGIAQELTHAITSLGLPLAVHQAIYKVNRIYEDYGVKLGSYSLFSPRRSKQKLILFPLAQCRKGHLPLVAERPFLLVKSNPSQSYSFKGSEKISETFQLGLTSEASDMLQIIAQVKPKELYFFGAYAKQYAEVAKSSFPHAKALFPNDQPPCFKSGFNAHFAAISTLSNAASFYKDRIFDVAARS